MPPKLDPRHRGRTAIAQSYDAIVKPPARRGIAREPVITPRELALRMVARGDVGATQVDEPDRAVLRRRGMGGRSEPAAESRAVALAVEIRAVLDAAHRGSRSTRPGTSPSRVWVTCATRPACQIGSGRHAVC